MNSIIHGHSWKVQLFIIKCITELKLSRLTYLKTFISTFNSPISNKLDMFINMICTFYCKDDVQMEKPIKYDQIIQINHRFV